jgi:intracellular sulfur oxidation DsrE/DsrF family protein
MVKHRVDRAAGKWRRAVSIVENMPTAREATSVEVIKITSPAIAVLNTTQNDNLFDMYSVGHKEVTREMCEGGIEVPFQHTLNLLGPKGEIVRIAVLFDGCAMVSAMCITVFKKVKHRLGEWGRSEKQLRMGNGVIILSLVMWKGKLRLGGITVEGTFKVFNSGGNWAFLLGKPLLRSFQAKQAYWPDTVTICDKNNKEEVLQNEFKKPRAGRDKRGVNLTLDVKQCDAVAGGSSEMNPPSREVPHSVLEDLKETYTDMTAFPVNVTTMVDSEAVLMREDNPHKTEHVTRIVQEVTVGLDIMEDQHQAVQGVRRLLCTGNK